MLSKSLITVLLGTATILVSFSSIANQANASVSTCQANCAGAPSVSCGTGNDAGTCSATDGVGCTYISLNGTYEVKQCPQPKKGKGGGTIGGGGGNPFDDQCTDPWGDSVPCFEEVGIY